MLLLEASVLELSAAGDAAWLEAQRIPGGGEEGGCRQVLEKVYTLKEAILNHWCHRNAGVDGTAAAAEAAEGAKPRNIKAYIKF